MFENVSKKQHTALFKESKFMFLVLLFRTPINCMRTLRFIGQFSIFSDIIIAIRGKRMRTLKTDLAAVHLNTLTGAGVPLADDLVLVQGAVKFLSA